LTYAGQKGAGGRNDELRRVHGKLLATDKLRKQVDSFDVCPDRDRFMPVDSFDEERELCLIHQEGVLETSVVDKVDEFLPSTHTSSPDVALRSPQIDLRITRLLSQELVVDEL